MIWSLISRTRMIRVRRAMNLRVLGVMSRRAMHLRVLDAAWVILGHLRKLRRGRVQEGRPVRIGFAPRSAGRKIGSYQPQLRMTLMLHGVEMRLILRRLPPRSQKWTAHNVKKVVTIFRFSLVMSSA